MIAAISCVYDLLFWVCCLLVRCVCWLVLCLVTCLVTVFGLVVWWVLLWLVGCLVLMGCYSRCGSCLLDVCFWVAGDGSFGWFWAVSFSVLLLFVLLLWVGWL